MRCTLARAVNSLIEAGINETSSASTQRMNSFLIYGFALRSNAAKPVCATADV